MDTNPTKQRQQFYRDYASGQWSMSLARLHRRGTIRIFSYTTPQSSGNRVSPRTQDISKSPRNTRTVSSRYGSSAARRISAKR